MFESYPASKVFFTSDTHFGHQGIMTHCNRPFKDVKEMDETLIANWNKVIKPGDIVFHLGDFAWSNYSVWKQILPRLNGNITFIVGNHDRKILYRHPKLFKYKWLEMYIHVDKQPIYLNHCPFLCYDGTYARDIPTWQLFGHVHSGPLSTSGLDIPRLKNLFPYQYDVGVDNNNFTPVSFYQVKEIIDKQVKEYKENHKNNENSSNQ